MTDQKITVGLEIQSNSAKETTQAERLGAALKSAAESAQKIKVPSSGTTGGTSTGVKSVMQKSQPVGAEAVKEYGQLRGSAAATGADARDFARQSEGLGGLVRVYATLAANIYALSAAFNALSRAMDTANMVEGLNQLGAASGRDLGSLAKRLVAATDGAINLREALSATAKGSSAGISGQNMERLAEGAKKAGQALGVDVTDALNRLTRGVTKLEPELLDELGIFLKIDDASQKYARSIGKNVNQLTDYEKRQASLNEVLGQLETKFGKIELAANPYQKLLASTQNLLQSMLELIAKGLTPIVSLLASSPTALAGVLSAIGFTILGKLIPTISSWRSSVKDSLEVYRGELQLNQQAFLQVSKNAQSSKQSLQSIAALRSSLMQEAGQTLDLNRAKAIDDQLKKLRELEGTVQASEKKGGLLTRVMGKFSPEQLQAMNLEKVGRRLKGMELLDKTLENTQSIGFGTSMQMLKGDLGKLAADPSFGKIRAGFLGIRVAGAAAAIGITGAFATLLPIIAAVGLAFEAVSFALDLTSSGKKELEEFNESLEKVKASTESATRTLEYFNSVTGVEKASIDGVLALSNVFTDLSESAALAVRKNEKAKESLGGWAKFKNWFSQLWGGDIDSQLAEGLAGQLNSAVNLLGPRGEEFKSKLKDLLSVDSFDTKTLEESLKKVDSTTREKIVGALKQVDDKLKESSSNLQQFKSAVENLDKSYSDFILSTASSDPLFKVGAAVETVGATMLKAATGPVEDLNAAMLELTKNPRRLAAFGSEFALALENLKPKLEDQTNAVKAYDDLIVKLEADLKKLPSGPQRRVSDSGRTYEIPESDARKNAEQYIKNVKAARDEISKSDVFETSRNLFIKGIELSAKEGARLIDLALNQASARAQITIDKAKAGALAGPAKISEETALAQKELNLQERLIVSNIALITSQETLAAEVAYQTAESKLARAQKENKSDSEIGDAAANAEAARLFAKYIKDPKFVLPTKEQLTGKGAEFGGLFTEKQANLLLSQFRLSQVKYDQQIAAQNAARTGVQAQRQAATIAGTQKLSSEVSQEAIADTQRNAQKGAAEVTKIRNLEQIAALTAGTLSLEKELASIELERKNFLEQIKSKVKEINVQRAQDSKTPKLLGIEEKDLDNLEKYQKLEKEAQSSVDQQAATYDTLNKKAQRTDAEEKRLTLLNKQRSELTRFKELVDLIQLGKLTEDSRKQQQIQQEINLELAKRNKQEEVSKARRELVNQMLQSSLELEQARTLGQANLNQAAASYTLALEQQFARKKIDAEYTKSVGDAEVALENKLFELKLRRSKITGNTTEDVAARGQIDAEIARQQLLSNTAIAGLGLRKSTSLELLDINKGIADQQQRSNEYLEKANTFADSLKEAFSGMGEGFQRVGEGLSSLVQVSAKFTLESKNNTKALQDMLDKLAETDELGNKILQGKDRENMEKAAGDQAAKNRMADQKYALDSISSMKKMFKEKSAAAKAFGAIEKALHIQRMIMNTVEIAMNFKKVAGEVATAGIIIGVSMKKAGAYALEAITSAFKGGFPMGFIAGAAMIAIMGALLGKAFGGGNKTPPKFTPNAEQRQETQGTAMGWDPKQKYDSEGKKIQVREGVFGDTSAKSESIARSLDVIKRVTVAGMPYNDKMLKSLEKLNDTMKSLGKSIYTIPGIRTGSAFGTVEGKRSGGWALNKTTTETEIIDAGIRLQGSFKDFIAGPNGIVNAAIDQFEMVKTTSVKRRLRGTRQEVKIDPKYEALAPETVAAFSDAFGKGYETLMEVGVSLGLSKTNIDDILSKVPVEELISLRGLKGEELQTQLNAVIGSVLDDATKELAPSLREFREFGEGLFETAVRVTDTNRKVNQLMKNLGGVTTNIGFDMSEAMVQMAGGLEEFVRKSDFFSENFLTAQERLAPKQKAVRDELKRLNLGWVKTRGDFKDIVQALIATGKQGSQLYADLMNLAEGFAEVTPEAENLTKSIEDLQNAVKSAAEERIKELQSARDEYKNWAQGIRDFQRSLKIGALSPLKPQEKYLENKTEFQRLIELAKQDTDEGKDARSKLQSAASAFLESSRLMYSSGVPYTQDYESVQAALSSVATFADEQVSAAERQIEEVKKAVKGIATLDDSINRLPEAISAGIGTKLAEALRDYNKGNEPEPTAAQTAADIAARNPQAAASAAEVTAPVYRSNAELMAGVPAGSSYSSITSNYSTAPADAGNNDMLAFLLGGTGLFNFDYGSTVDASYQGSQYDPYQNVSAGATGSNYIPNDQMLYVHKGERLMPAADNSKLMNFIDNYASGGSGSNAELYAEVCRLTKQVETLTQVVADGAIMNAQATDRNTQELSGTITDSNNKNQYMQKLQSKIEIV